MKSVTIKDIAKKCGVAVSTVSRAINNHPDISEETKKKVMAVIKEKNFIPNKSAQNLKLSDTRTIAVLIKGIDNPFFQSMIKVFEEETKRMKYSFILQKVEYKQDEVEVALELIKEKKLKGIVFLGGSFYHQENKLKEINIPFVLSTISMDDSVDKKLYSSVALNNRYESKKVVDFLCNLGHRRIAILGDDNEDKSISRLRIEGYKDSLRENKIEINEKLIMYRKEKSISYTMENGYKLMKELLKSREKFTAVYAISDTMAIGALRAILESGKKVPNDCSVIGFDGLDIGNYYNPSITTLRQPTEEMARETIKILFDLIDKEIKNYHKILNGELIIRESTASLNKLIYKEGSV